MIKSTCSDLKLSAQSPHRLADYEEARDLLLRVFLKDGFCIAIFRFGAVALPDELEPQLRALVGHEIAILRLSGRYYIREVMAGG
ncbi:MAG: hypothetical protein WA127_05525 [Methanothrix sp.]